MRVFAITMLLLFVPMVIMAAVPMAIHTENSSSTYDEANTEVSTKDEAIITEYTLLTEETTIIEHINTNTVYSSDVVLSTTDESILNHYHYDLLARAIYQESGSCSEYCQWLVGSAILNLADERGGVENVVFDYNTINVAYVLYDAIPSDLSYRVAKQLLCGNRDYNVKYFRTEYYHGFGTPYTNVDNVYFSTG